MIRRLGQSFIVARYFRHGCHTRTMAVVAGNEREPKSIQDWLHLILVIHKMMKSCQQRPWDTVAEMSERKKVYPNRSWVWNEIEIMYELSAHVSVYAATWVIKLMTVRPSARSLAARVAAMANRTICFWLRKCEMQQSSHATRFYWTREKYCL